VEVVVLWPATVLHFCPKEALADGRCPVWAVDAWETDENMIESVVEASHDYSVKFV